MFNKLQTKLNVINDRTQQQKNQLIPRQMTLIQKCQSRTQKKNKSQRLLGCVDGSTLGQPCSQAMGVPTRLAPHHQVTVPRPGLGHGGWGYAWHRPSPHIQAPGIA